MTLTLQTHICKHCISYNFFLCASLVHLAAAKLTHLHASHMYDIYIVHSENAIISKIELKRNAFALFTMTAARTVTLLKINDFWSYVFNANVVCYRF